MEFQFLGTGNAAQVPCYGCNCIACQRARTMTIYRRNACSAKIITEQGTLLIDAGLPDLCERFAPGVLHSILLTHYHMDHVQGLFHLRWGNADTIPVIGPADESGCDDLFKHPGLLNFLPPPRLFERILIAGLHITPLPLYHSKPCVGYLIDDGRWSLVYLTDTLLLPPETERFLIAAKPDVVIIDCSFPPTIESKNHNGLNEALAVIDSLNPAKASLTHIGHELDAFLISEDYSLPDNIFVANDNEMIIYDNVTPLASKF